jgi:hypothetical protein
MDFIIGISLFLPIIANGISTVNNVESVKKNIRDINDQTDKLNKKNIDFKALYDLNFNEQQDYTQDISEFFKIKNDTEIAFNNFINDVKKIQLTGIIIIVVVFFLLLLKQFGVLRTIIDILEYPFIYIYNSIFNKGKKIK